MKINKALYTGIILSSTLIIAGCGSDDNSGTTSNGQNNSGPIVNNEFKYTVYDIFSDVVDDKYRSAWGKLKYSIRENGLREEISTVVGSSSSAYQNSRSPEYNDLDYYAGNNFFIAVTEDFDNRYYKINFIDNDTFRLKIQKDNAVVNSTYDILTYDLNGVGKFGNEDVVGIYTDLGHDYFPDGITFPASSKCYVLQETPEQSYYNFSNTATSNKITIAQWLEHKKRLGYEINNVVQEKVGQNNSLSAIRFNENSGEFYAAVEFNGLVYEADYLQKGVKEFLVTDPKTGVVECYLYNDTAAKFMDKQIKSNY